MGRTYPEVLYEQRDRLKQIVWIQQIAIAILAAMNISFTCYLLLATCYF